MTPEIGFGCAVGPDIILCSPRGFRYRTVMFCRVCKRRRRFMVAVFVWYGAEFICCGCSTRWSDGECRPASRSVKRRAAVVRTLNSDWLSTAGTRKDAEAWLRAAVAAELEEAS